MRRLGGGERYESMLAWDERRYALVVVKVLRPHLVGERDALDGLAAEAAMLERLRHPVLLRSFEAVLDGPRPAVVLEHLEGPRLSTLIRKYGPVEREQLLPLGLQLFSAIHYLAGEGVVHLDVKPSNVIMGAPARLIDLSVARPLASLRPGSGRIGTDASPCTVTTALSKRACPRPRCYCGWPVPSCGPCVKGWCWPNTTAATTGGTAA